MKKVFALMLLLATMVSFTACSDDDDEPVSSELLGTWKVTEISEDGVTYYPMSATNIQTSTITFRDNGRVLLKGGLFNGNYDFSYKQKGNTITMKDDAGDSASFEIKQLSSSTATFKLSHKDFTNLPFIKCVKQ